MPNNHTYIYANTHLSTEPIERLPPAAEQRLLRRRREVLEKLNSLEAPIVEAANNEFLAICDDIEFGANTRDRTGLDNVEDREEGVEDRSVEKRRWKT